MTLQRITIVIIDEFDDTAAEEQAAYEAGEFDLDDLMGSLGTPTSEPDITVTFEDVER